LGQGRYDGIWKVDIDVCKDDEWIHVYEGSPVFDEWWLHRFDGGAVSQMRIRAFGLNYLHHPYLRVYEADFFKNTVYP
jgi:hypothetical protein